MIDLTPQRRQLIPTETTVVYRSSRYAVLVAIAVFLLLAVSYARTKNPWLDEGLQGSAAYSLIAHGHFAIPQLEETGMTITTRLPEIQHYCYIFGPNYLLAAAGWMKLFGYGLLQLRSFSMLWAIFAMLAWYIIIERLARDRFAAGLGVLLLAVNYQFVIQAANGRFDMMCASLGSIGLAVFLLRRGEGLSSAIFVSSLAAAASFFTHPMGALYAVALAWMILVLDFRRLRPVHAWWLIAPWCLFAAGVAIWIWPHREIAAAQFAAHTHSRWRALANPLAAILSDAKQRYLFFFLPAEGPAFTRIKALILVIQLIFIGIAALLRPVRTSLAFRVLAPALVITYCGVALLDNLRFPYYMLHTFLFASAIVAIAASALRHTGARYAAGAGIGVLILIQVAGIAAKVRENSYAGEYEPVIRYIQAHASPADYVEGDISLNFGLGYSDSGFHMDNRMGYYTGVHPALIITDEFADFDYIRIHEPDVYRFIRHRLDVEYRRVAQIGEFSIYAPA